ncbi:MAG: 2-methylaconitate cis-trans isomerase PrpF family protein [Janthinobacterium lividum]
MTSKYRAVFARGGTSKALMFHLADLPADRAQWDALFLSAMGSPDPYGRQLDGMGGGVSSLSKVCVIGPPSRPDADVDYTFVQVQISEASCDYSGNCGNMSSAIGPFAIDEGLLQATGEQATVRVHNTNTGKIINSTFPLKDGRSVEAGELVIPGVSGSGAPVRLDFLDPGGASTGKLLPAGQISTVLSVPGVGDVEVSMVDAANACVFVAATSLGLRGNELPAELEENPAVLKQLAAIREAASVAMGITPTLEAARAKKLIPFVAFVSGPQDSPSLSGDAIAADSVDLTVRMISNGQPHRALPLTGSLCTAVASQLSESVVQRLARPGRSGALRLGMPSGVITVDAEVQRDANANGGWKAMRGSFFRTTRRLFEGFVYA